MLRVLYVDALCPSGHRVFNSLTISALKDLKAELKLVGHERCLPDKINIAYRIPKRYLAKRKAGSFSKFSYRIREYQKLQWLLKVIEKEHPDLVILSSYETISLSMVSSSLKIPVLAFNHNNIDELGSRVKRYFYRRIGGSVTQVVFENYMADYLKNNIKVRSEVIVLPHIVESNERSEFQAELPTPDSMLLFAPSSSNDFSLIEDLLMREDEIRSNGIKLVAKFKEDVSQDSIILRKRFSDKEYDSFLRSCSAVFVPLPRSFNYRISNVVNEAIANGKKIIMGKNLYSGFLFSKYPSLVYILSNSLVEQREDLRVWLKKEDMSYEEERRAFIAGHSSSAFLYELSVALESNRQ